MVPILQTATIPPLPGICASDTGDSCADGAFSAVFDGTSDRNSTVAAAEPEESGRINGTHARMTESDETEVQREVLDAQTVFVQPNALGFPVPWSVDQKILVAAGQDSTVAVEAQADVHVSSQTAPFAFVGPVLAIAETGQIDVPARQPLIAPSGPAEALGPLPSLTSRRADLQLVEASTASDGVIRPKPVLIAANVEEPALASNPKIAPMLGTDAPMSSILPATLTRGHETLSHSAFLARWGGTEVQLPGRAPTPDPGDTVASEADPDIPVSVGADTVIRGVAQKPATNDIALPIINQYPGVEEKPVSEQAAPTVSLPVEGDFPREQGNSAPPRVGKGQELPFTAGPALTMKDGQSGPAVMMETLYGAAGETPEADRDFSPLMIQSHLALPLTHGQNAIAQPVSALAAQVVQVLSSGGSGKTDIAMSPEELGHVRLSIQPHDSDPTRVMVMMSFERPEVMDLFRRHADQLLADIRAAGYSGADLSFAQSGTGDRHDGKPGAVPARGNSDAAPSTPLHETPMRRSDSSSLDLRL